MAARKKHFFLFFYKKSPNFAPFILKSTIYIHLFFLFNYTFNSKKKKDLTLKENRIDMDKKNRTQKFVNMYKKKKEWVMLILWMFFLILFSKNITHEMRMLYVEEVYLISELGKIIIIIFINLCWVFSVYEHALDALFPPVLINKYPERGKREWKARNMQRQRDANDGRQIDERQTEKTCHAMLRYTAAQLLFLARAWITPFRVIYF